MSNPISDWFEAICVQIGICDEPAPEGTTGPVGPKTADKNLKNKECTDEGSSSPQTSSIPSSRSLWTQAKGLDSRMKAITRAVHKMIENGPTECGRPTDPTVISLDQRQQNVGYELSQLMHINWDKMNRTAHYAHVNALAGKISRLECDVKANM